MSVTLRSIISLLIAIIIVGAVYASMPSYQLAPQGIVLPANGNKPPYKGDVKLYSSSEAPLDSENIGNISVEYHSTTISPEAQTRLINKAKVLAAQAGGNGLLFSMGQTIASTPSSLAISVLQGVVIKQ